MSDNKTNKKPRTLVRESRIEKTQKDATAGKDKKTIIKKNVKEDTYRSGSLSRDPPRSLRESPRKSHSVDRRLSNNIRNSNPTKENTTAKNINALVDKKFPVNSKESSSRPDKKENKNVKTYTTSKKTPSSNKSQVKSKTSEKRTNAQIAKSFVQNASSNSLKHSEMKKKTTKLIQQDNSKKVEESFSLIRPQTSTIRKEPGLTPAILNDDEEEKAKLVKNTLSRSRTSLKGESEEEKASYEDDFEDYNSDFEETDTDSSSDSHTSTSSSSSEQQEDVPIDINEEDVSSLNVEPEKSKLQTSTNSNKELSTFKKKNSEKTFLKMSDRTSLYSKDTDPKPSTVKLLKPSRSYINFDSAIQKEDNDLILKQSEDKLENEFYQVPDVESNTVNILLANVSNRSTIKSNSKQVYVQTENSETEEIQTEEIKSFDTWTQYPLNGTKGYGGDNIHMIDKTNNWKLLFNPHSVKLSSFLQRSSHIILTLLEEESSVNNENSLTKRRQEFFNSKGFYSLPPLKLLEDIPISNIYSSSSASPYILTIYGNMIKLPSSIECDEEKGIICVWNIMNNKKPEHILMANSQPICGTFGPGGSDIVIAGMVDGTVMLWDLINFNSTILIKESDEVLPVLPSTYNTAMILGSENHNSCIVGIQAVYNQTEVNWKAASSVKTSYSKNFHIITLEDLGVIIIWVVVEVLKPDISGLESDLGLAPGGKFRLVRSSSINLLNLASLQMEQRMNMRTFEFRLVPQDSSRMLVTTDIGLVLHITRHSGTVEPRFYCTDSAYTCEVRCIDCSPHNKDLFLIGCSDGSVKLYNTKIVRPVMEFLCSEKGESANHLQWSTIQPSVFFVLSSSSNLQLWNLMHDTLHPFQNCDFLESRITWFALQTIEKRTNQDTSEKCFNFLVSKENGEVEVHLFKQKLSNEDYVQELNFMENL